MKNQWGSMKYYWFKSEKGDKIWWKRIIGVRGPMIFSFDKKKEFNLWEDYPHALTEEELAIFNKENPFWVDFFSDNEDDEKYDD